MRLSVIIPTLNRASLLRHTLASIKKQTLPKTEFEIIVVDNGSTDNTMQICQEYEKENGNLVYIYDNHVGLHNGRNRGFKESRADILVYADDDIEAGTEWLETIDRGFKDDSVFLIGGNNYPIYETNKPPWFNRLWVYDHVSRCQVNQIFSVVIIGNYPRIIDPYMVFGCNYAVRKSVVKAAGGFHPDGVPDNYLRYRGDGETYISEFIKKKKMKTMFYPGASIGHRITQSKMTKDYVKKVAFRSGISDAFSKLREISSGRQYMSFLKKTLLNFESHIRIMDNSSIVDSMVLFYYKGELFLLREYGLHKNIRSWVKRENYLDAIIPS